MPEVFKVTKTTFKDEQELIKFLKGIQNNITSFEVLRGTIKVKFNNNEIILPNRSNLLVFLIYLFT